MVRILFDYEYDKYLGASGFLVCLVSRNNGTIKPLFVCTKTNNYGSGLRAAARYHANEKAFRLNKYENCGQILKHIDPLNYLVRITVLNSLEFTYSYR